MKLRQLVSRLPKSDSRETRELVAALAHIFRQSDNAWVTKAEGGQIKFPATQNASSDANTLDDYEEGTWTPVLTFATPGNVSVTYSTQSADYTKIGRLVHANFSIITSAFTHTTASGNLRITGLPFTVGAELSAGAVFFGGITKASYTQVVARATNGVNYIDLVASGSGVGAAAVTASDCPTGGVMQLRGSVVFRV